LFDHIVHHKFEPGAAYNTCHHGISLLAVSMRSHAAQEHERQEDDYFDQATMRTPDAVRKHSAKAPPPLPTSIAELMQLLWRLIVLTEGLFTAHCSLVIQLRAMHEAMQNQEQTIMGDPTAMAEWLPQLAWAIISASRAFYGHISTRAEIDPAEHASPRFAVANLSIYTSMFQAGIKFNLDTVPPEWRRKEVATHAAPKRPETAGDNKGKEHRWGANPFANDGGTTPSPTAGDNPKYPRCFAASDLTQRLRNHKDAKGRRIVTITEIAKAGGIAKPSDLTVDGIPNGTCLSWLLWGNCSRKGCKFPHPAGVDEAGAARLLKLLEPGMKRVLEKGQQPTEGGQHS
jgi:hypothetical protein